LVDGIFIWKNISEMASGNIEPNYKHRVFQEIILDAESNLGSLTFSTKELSFEGIHHYW
jgi:hypothetical protein